MPISELTSRAAVLEAIEEFDRLGRTAFLKENGYGKARELFVRHRGKLYDSKAISGVAYSRQFPERKPLRGNLFTGGRLTSGGTLEKLGFEVISRPRAATPRLQKNRVYSWEELGSLFDFKPEYLSTAGGMIPRPKHDAVLLITHPAGGRSFNYYDYWDGDELIYTGRGQKGDQELAGANRDVAENSRELLLFEHTDARRLRFLGLATCKTHWETTAPDRDGADRRIYRFRLQLTSPRGNKSSARPRGRQKNGTRPRDASSFKTRPFDPNRTSASRKTAKPSDLDQQRVLAEKADQAHQATLKSLGLWLGELGWYDLEEIDRATDLVATRPPKKAAKRVLFEVKSITMKNERSRVRSGLAQLLEYRLFLGEPDDGLCLVTNSPISDHRLQLLDSLEIGHLYIEGGSPHISDTGASRNTFRQPD